MVYRKHVTLGLLLVCFSFIVPGCRYSVSQKKVQTEAQANENLGTSFMNPNGPTIFSRFETPKGFEKVAVDSSSFGYFLRNLPLKEPDAPVLYYNGEVKPNSAIYEAVVALPIGKKDLHQCADAIIRLRADYLYQEKKYDSIHFNFTNGFNAAYAEWRKGKRIVVNGNRVFWKQKARPSDRPEDFWNYLEMVFSYAGTASLEKELVSISPYELQIGDVFIQGGFPGHAVIVVDLASHPNTGEKIFLLAQSYMPAQEIQVLTNPNDDTLSPWYRAETADQVTTPEWIFEWRDLKRF
ncbi:DUF4846 domain-containing protein [Flavobacteriaceae bacterium TP-CH-4]|uniref:DUF4846 domain-containing protein n=2 Tax=Pelagihabitans pacificus TaxID=2696054 RepID=A0A967AX04_9FLAO|nr:DUF4846 domain-containing protein [Pelagihabitans pacificus]